LVARPSLLPHQARLEDVLSESVAEAKIRERSEFDRLSEGLHHSIVLFGARKLGRKTLVGLRQAGIEPLAFADNNPELWNTWIDGVQVFSPTDAAAKFGRTATFVITIWGRGSTDPMKRRIEELQAHGCKVVVPFVPLFWKHAEYFLPHNAMDLPHRTIEEAGDILKCFQILEDEASRRELLNQVTWRVTGDFDALSDPVSDEIYFPHEIGRTEVPEVFVDCGAYDGDTVLRFLARNECDVEKIFAFEPDPSNLAALHRTIKSLPAEIRDRIQVSAYATGAREEVVRFSATGTLGASVGNGDLEVQCVCLDRVVGEANPTYIKMDIEAAEPDAIAGAHNLLRRCSPVLAACAYHVYNHAWRIPLVIYDINPGLAILLRQHIQLVEDLVCYAVPRERLAIGRTG
jgi:FkbM family methyltransferase